MAMKKSQKKEAPARKAQERDLSEAQMKKISGAGAAGKRFRRKVVEL